MNIINAAILIIAGFFAAYGVACSVECGIVLKMLTKDKVSRRMFTPLWEITNVLLVFGFTALAILFNGALASLSQALISTLSVALFAMLARACLVLFIFYIKDEDTLGHLWVWLLAITSFLVPLSFAAAGIYLLTGQLFYQSWLGAILGLSTLIGLIGGGLVMVNRKQTGRRLLPGELVMALWYLLLGCVLPLVVTHKDTGLNQLPILIMCLGSGAGLVLILASSIGFKLIKLWQSVVLSILAAPLLLAWANEPYLINAKLTLRAAYGAQTYGSAVVLGLFIMLPFIALGGWLFLKLLPAQTSKKSRPTA